MFRKPKKTTKTSFRSRQSTQKRNSQNKKITINKDEDSGEDAKNNKRNAASHGRKRFRVNTNDSSSDETSETSQQESGNLNRFTTSELLDQLKNEKQQQRESSSSKFSAKERKRSKARILHAFESADLSKVLTAKELATRGAEFHPKERDASDRTKQQFMKGDAHDLYADGPQSQEAIGASKIYKGENSTRNKFLAGPLKAPTFVRTTSRFDYQPDICKDYKDTGFCGYGDTCIYLHDRGDTKAGWQLELEWEERKKKEREKKEAEMDKFARGEDNIGGMGDGNSQEQPGVLEDDGLPFGCHLCRSAFNDPIVSRCGHYFCKSCIIQQVRSHGDACPICKKDTQGVFNHPIKLISKKRRLFGSKATWEAFAEAFSKK